MKEGRSWFPEVFGYCTDRADEFDLIPKERKIELESIGDYLSIKKLDNQEAKLTVICTHNSRRSHYGQIWLQIATDFYGMRHIKTFSGGTESTAFHINAVNALEKVGFEVTVEPGDNPIYKLSYGSRKWIECFSKTFDNETNPTNNFAAIMVCNDAAEACPIVAGAERRFVLPYDDPKAFDGTDLAEVKYAERCSQIAREMFFVVWSALSKQAAPRDPD